MKKNIVCTLRVDDFADAGIGKQRHDFRFRTAPAELRGWGDGQEL